MGIKHIITKVYASKLNITERIAETLRLSKEFVRNVYTKDFRAARGEKWQVFAYTTTKIKGKGV